MEGLTLIEVMVAVLILSLSLGAVVISASHVMRSTARVQALTLAQWVADGVDLELRAGVWGPIGNFSSVEGTEIMGEQAWHWIAQSRADEHMIQVDIGVFAVSETTPLLTHTSYMALP